MRVTDAPQDFEDRVANVLCPLLQAYDVLLDLHSFLGATVALFLMLLTLSACGPESQNLVDESDLGEVTELDWDALIPGEWRPEQLLEGLSGDGASLDQISDEDPRADAIMDKITALWKQAPVVDAVDGQRVKLPGVVPRSRLSSQTDETGERQSRVSARARSRDWCQ